MNEYAQKLIELADTAFAEVRGLRDEVEAAGKEVESVGHGSDPVSKAKAARAEARMKAAQEQEQGFKYKSYHYEVAANRLKDEYEKELAFEFTVDPKQVDANVMQLLDSGILNVNDYTRLFNEAAEHENVTMMRLIGAAAEKAARDLRGSDGTRLRLIAFQSRQAAGGEKLKAFSAAVDAFVRRMHDSRLVFTDTWDATVIPALERL